MLDLDLQVEILKKVHNKGVIALSELINELKNNADLPRVKINLSYLIENGQLTMITDKDCKLSNALLHKMYPSFEGNTNYNYAKMLRTVLNENSAE